MRAAARMISSFEDSGYKSLQQTRPVAAIMSLIEAFYNRADSHSGGLYNLRTPVLLYSSLTLGNNLILSDFLANPAHHGRPLTHSLRKSGAK